MSVPKLATISLLVFITVATVVGPSAGAVAAAATNTSTTVSVTTTLPEVRRSASGTTHTVTVGLLAIAGVTAAMGSAYFWYTIPSRRQRIAERRR